MHSPLSGQWQNTNSAQPGMLAASLEEFTGHPAYGLAELRGDLERFIFLLGGSDGEQLFRRWPAVWLPLSPGSIVREE